MCKNQDAGYEMWEITLQTTSVIEQELRLEDTNQKSRGEEVQVLILNSDQPSWIVSTRISIKATYENNDAETPPVPLKRRKPPY